MLYLNATNKNLKICDEMVALYKERSIILGT